jgi:PAS domain S-box-containing protein
MGLRESLLRGVRSAAASARERFARGVRAAALPSSPIAAVATTDGGARSTLRGSIEMETLLDALPDLVMIHRDGVLLWVNQAMVDKLEYEHASQIVGRTFADIVPLAYQELLRVRLEAVSRGAEMDVTPEAAVLTRSGRTVITEIGRPITVSFDGAPARLLVGRDITERMRMHQRLVIADRMAAVGMLAAGVAHEVNNPLGYVLNNIELVSADLETFGPRAAKSRASLTVALEGVDRIRAIVRQLLLLTRSDGGAASVLDARATVESTLMLASSEIGRRAKLECTFEQVPPVWATESRLGQVLLNLVVNALDAMGEESPETNLLAIRVHASGEDSVRIEVADNGPGIAPEHAARIFDPFFTTKDDRGGTGLGLSISQRMLAEIGGELSFESETGRGTTFRIVLRAVSPDAPRPPVT